MSTFVQNIKLAHVTPNNASAFPAVGTSHQAGFNLNFDPVSNLLRANLWGRPIQAASPSDQRSKLGLIGNGALGFSDGTRWGK